MSHFILVHGAWEESGSLNATQRATKIWQIALEDYSEPTLDSAIREELDRYIANRKQEIGTDDP